MHSKILQFKALLLVTNIFIFTTAKSQIRISENQQKILQVFQCGVNISLFENYWSKPEAIFQQNIAAKILQAHKIGFKTIRLPVNFDHYVKKDGKLDNRILEKIAQTYTMIDSLGMTMILTYHYGQEKKKMDLMTRVNEIIDRWKQVIYFFKNFGYENLAFGLFNEPRISGQDLNTGLRRANEILRPLDTERFWIVGPTDYNKIDSFDELIVNSNPQKIIYTFHFYEPYIFTHQGVPWDKKNVPLTGLPYPYNPSEMPPFPSSLNGNKDMVYNYQHYNEVANKAFLRSKIMLAYQWAAEHKKTLICTEFGSYETIPAKYRNNYIKDVTDVLAEFGIPALVWELDQNFRVIEKNKQPMPAIIEWTNKFKGPEFKN